MKILSLLLLFCTMSLSQASEVTCDASISDIQDLSDLEDIQKLILKDSCLNYSLNPVPIDDIDKKQLKKEAIEGLRSQIGKYLEKTDFSKSLRFFKPTQSGVGWRVQIGCFECFADDEKIKEQLYPSWKEFWNKDIGSVDNKLQREGERRSDQAKKTIVDDLTGRLRDVTIYRLTKVNDADQTAENEDLLGQMDHIDKMIEAKNKLCINGVETVVKKDNGFKYERFNYDDPEDFKNSYNKLFRKVRDAMDQSNDFHQKICTPITSHFSGLYNVKNSLEIDLKGKVFFEDNKYDLHDGQKKVIRQAIDKGINSLKTEKCDVRIKSANIFTSSSLLRNRIIIDGKEQLDKSFDFVWLSKQRAEHFENFIYNYSKEKEINVLPKKNWNLDYLGINGNGTGGPCPYELDEQGNPRTNPEIVKDLDEHKYAKAYIEFEQFGTECLETNKEQTPKPVYHLRSQCFNVRFNCKK